MTVTPLVIRSVALNHFVLPSLLGSFICYIQNRRFGKSRALPRKAVIFLFQLEFFALSFALVKVGSSTAYILSFTPVRSVVARHYSDPW